MRPSKIQIKSLFGIQELSLGDKDYEILGTNGTAKTSILEAIRYAIKNKTDKDVILRKGADEGEVLIEMDTGLTIRNRERTGKATLRTLKDGKTPILQIEGFLRELFSPMQLNPIEFVGMPKEEQNRIILDLIDYKWDMEKIKKWFGEVPQEIDYSQNILKVLADIQSDSGRYFRTRQELQRESRNKTAFVEEIAKSLPDNYKAEDWRNASLSESYRDIERIRHDNGEIEKAQSLIDSQENKMRGFDSERQIAVSALDAEISGDRNRYEKDIVSLETQIGALKEKLSGLGEKEAHRKKEINLEYKASIAEFEASIKENKKIAARTLKDPSELKEKAEHTEKMKGLLGEYDRMTVYVKEVDKLIADAAILTVKIEKARTLPAEILAQSKLPLENLSIENGLPLINGLPISNLSDGEKLDLCVDIASMQKNAIDLLLVDGAEKLSPDNRKRLYAKCKKRKIRFIATCTTNDKELIVVEL